MLTFNHRINSNVTTVREALSKSESALTDAGVDNPRLEAERLLSFALSTNRAGLLIRLRDEIDDETADRLKGLVDRRASRVPLQYITGSEEFMGLEFYVGPSVLIPRPETELLARAAVGFLKGRISPLVADIGAGSGCIAISIALNAPDATVYAVDISPDALEIAGRNISAHAPGRVRLLKGDLLAPLADEGLSGKLDLIVSNPPYIPSGEIPGLQPEVLREPMTALDGGIDGLDVIRRLIDVAPEFLKPGGALMMEIGYNQSEAVSGLVSASPFLSLVSFSKDFAGIERVVIARRSQF